MASRSIVLLAALLAGCGAPLGRELFVHGAPLEPADAIVVLGNRPATEGGEVAPETDRRVRRGVELFQRRLAPVLVLVGSAEEIAVMRPHAERLGVPAEAIRTDGRSRDTVDNARYAVERLCEERAACRPTIVLVSSPYHLRRARRLFECAGAEVQIAASALPEDPIWQASLAAYEYAVRLVYVFYDACAAARPAH